MKKTELCSKFREYVRKNLSPTKDEQGFVSKIYSSFERIAGNHLLQIGSYPRYTAIRPLHDLDILWILGEWNPDLHDPKEALEALKTKMENEYENPSKNRVEISLQTHSITVSYLNKNNDEVFAVDVIPAYSLDKNEFGDDMYMVPELLKQGHEKWQQFYGEFQEDNKKMGWIPSDPMGYIEITKTVNQKNSDFRKTVKFVKAWKNALKEKDETLKLKSFHIEQVITQYFQDNKKEMEIFDAIFKFFCEIPTIIEIPQIPDRADKSVMIDQYVADLTKDQKDKIKQARNCFLIKLEELEEFSSIAKLVEVCFYERNDPSEQYLFDFQIPVLINTGKKLVIDGCVKEKNGFREYKYRINTGWGKINANNYIRFEIVNPVSTAEYYLWKVKNDNNCDEPRGEITKNQTRKHPEYTKYPGEHFVECFAIVNKVCVAKARQDVIIDPKLKYQ